MYKFQEIAVKRLNLPQHFVEQIIYPMADPQFKIEGEWYWCGRLLGSLYKIEIPFGEQPPPSYNVQAVRDGCDGKIIPEVSFEFFPENYKYLDD